MSKRYPPVETGQVWADPSSGDRQVRIVSAPDVQAGDRGITALVETVKPAQPGGRTGQKSEVLIVNIARRFRLVQHADGTEAADAANA